MAWKSLPYLNVKCWQLTALHGPASSCHEAAAVAVVRSTTQSAVVTGLVLLAFAALGILSVGGGVAWQGCSRHQPVVISTPVSL